jgi:hypothetical protein
LRFFAIALPAAMLEAASQSFQIIVTASPFADQPIQ